MKLLKAMATVAGLTALSRIAGFVRDIMTAAILGAGPVADAFFVALKLPNMFRRITAEGAFSVSFVPIYSEQLEQEGRESADLFANRAFSLMLFGLAAFTLLAMVFMPVIIDLIAPGFGGTQPSPMCFFVPCEVPDPRYIMAVDFSRITFPYLLLMSLTSLLGGVMNAHDRFAPFAVAPVLFNLSLIAALLGAKYFDNGGEAMSWGIIAAGILQFLLLFITARRWIHFKIKIVRPQITPRIKRLFRLMGPGVLGAGVVQINLFADMIIGSLLPAGSISYLYYADRLNQLPLSTVGIAVGTALLPMLSRAVGAGNESEAKHLFNRALEVTLFLGLPAAAALFILAEPIITILFQRGAFTPEAAQATAFVLQGYIIGLPAYIAVKVFSTAFWSRQDTMTPVKVAAIVALSNIALALILIQFMGVAGIATATGIVGWLYVILLARPLRKQPAAAFDARFKKALPRIILSTVIMGAGVFALAEMMQDWIGGEFHLQVLALITLVLGGVVIYGGAVILTGVIGLSDLKKYILKGKTA